MKIKVTSTLPKTHKHYEDDEVPEGIYVDRDGDFIITTGCGDFACFSPDGEFLGDRVEWPITPAPKGTKIEITA